MAGLTVREAITIGTVGPFGAIFVFLLIELIGGQLFYDLIIGNIEQSLILGLITLTFFLFALIASIMVGLVFARTSTSNSVRIASLKTFVSSLLLLITLGYFSLFLFYPDVFSVINEWWGYFVIIPGVIVYFGIYVLESVIVLFVFMIIIYFMFFLYFIDSEYEYKNIPIDYSDKSKMW